MLDQEDERVQEGERAMEDSQAQDGRAMEDSQAQDERVREDSQAQEGERVREDTQAQDGERAMEGSQAQDGERARDDNQAQDGERAREDNQAQDRRAIEDNQGQESERAKEDQGRNKDNDEDECCICLGNSGLDYKLACGHHYCYLCIKELKIRRQGRCPLCRRDIEDDFDVPVKGEIKVSTDNLHWLYSGRSGGWWYYDPKTAIEIEDLYLKHISDHTNALEITILSKKYMLDFEKMRQVSLDGRAVRKIKRIDQSTDVLTKGIAGLKITNNN